MWKPNEEGLNELLNLFSNSKSQDNKKQSEIYNVSLKKIIISIFLHLF
jgi:hypothetical protein